MRPRSTCACRSTRARKSRRAASARTTTFIGGGNMATALIGGLLARGVAAGDFRVVEPVAEARTRLAARHPGVALHAECTRDAVAGAALIVVAVKPQQMREAAHALAA